MIAFNSQVLFVHNPKTAGTSLLAYLQAVLPGPVHLAGVNELGTNHPPLSAALNYACGVTGRSPDRVIAVIRNPFDREISMYRYFREVLANSPGLEGDLPDAAMRRRVMKAQALDFNPYLQSLQDEDGTVDIWRSRSFYQLAGGVPLESLKVLKFEKLADDLAEIFGRGQPPLPHANASSGRSEARFDAQSIKFVQASYDWIFKAGWYSPDAYRQRDLLA